MNTTSFLAALRANPELPLVFQAGAELVSPGYHLTEVKRVAYETMDCGAETHRWAETQFEVWTPAAAKAGDRGHMTAGKFLRIVERVQSRLPLADDTTARIYASFADQPAALHDVDAVVARDGRLWVELKPDQTRCKASERGCCGVASDRDGADVCCSPAPNSAAACCA